MDKGKIAELLGYLRSLGFEGTKLADAVTRYIDDGLTRFLVRHDTAYGKESIRFELIILMGEDKGYYLERIRAAYRRPVEIGPTADYHGIDIAHLESEMKRIDWDAYFNGGEVDDVYRQRLSKCLGNLATLYASENIGANEIHQQLIYQYWPKEVYELYRHPQIRHMAIDHEYRSEYPKEEGFPNTRLIYHMLSGKLDGIHDKLSVTGLEEFTGIDLRALLKTMLSHKSDSFNVICSKNTKEGWIEFEIPVRRENGDYEADMYRATFIPHPKIEHGIYNGIDSTELDTMMMEIDWLDDRQLFRFQLDEAPEFLPKVYDVQDQIYRLSQDLAGAEVADMLKLKYWIGATFFEDNIGEEAWEALAAREKLTLEFPLDFRAASLYHLACGRPVYDRTASETEGVDRWWKLTANREPEQMNGISSEELERQLRLLGVPSGKLLQASEALKEGQRAVIEISPLQKVYVETDPLEATLKLFTIDQKPIPFNFRLDPEWKPPEHQAGKARHLRKSSGKRM